MPHPYHYAVVIGIDYYPAFSNLSHAREDARAFYNWLVGEGGVPPENIRKVIVEEGPFPTAAAAKPTRDTIDDRLLEINTQVRQALTQNLERWNDTRLYVYVSGHGLAPGPRQAALLMANATDETPGYNLACWLYRQYYELSQDFREIVFFVDCCRTLRLGAPGSGPPWRERRKSYGNLSVAVGYATHYGDPAYEPPETANGDDSRGFYTRALLEGLNGAAADRETGAIDINTLQNYVRERVKALTLDKQPQQIPDLEASAAAAVVFRPPTTAAAPVAARPIRTITIHAPPGFAGILVIVGGKALTEVARCVVDGDGLAIAQLTDGLYEVQQENGVGFGDKGLFKVIGEARHVQL
jgi:uncharacterized caspase-like protein